MESIKQFYSLIDRLGELFGQQAVPIAHLTDAGMAPEVGEAKAALILVRNNIPIKILNELDKGPGEPYGEGDVPQESAEAFTEWFRNQPINKQFFQRRN